MHYLFPLIILLLVSGWSGYAIEKKCALIARLFQGGSPRLSNLLEKSDRLSKYLEKDPDWSNIIKKIATAPIESEHIIEIDNSKLKLALKISRNGRQINFVIEDLKMKDIPYKSRPDHISFTTSHLMGSIISGVNKRIDSVDFDIDTVQVKANYVINKEMRELLSDLGFEKSIGFGNYRKKGSVLLKGSGIYSLTDGATEKIGVPLVPAIGAVASQLPKIGKAVDLKARDYTLILRKIDGSVEEK